MGKDVSMQMVFRIADLREKIYCTTKRRYTYLTDAVYLLFLAVSFAGYFLSRTEVLKAKSQSKKRDFTLLPRCGKLRPSLGRGV